MRLQYFKDRTGGREVTPEEQSKLVKENWEAMAKERGTQPDATIRDLYHRKLQTWTVAHWLKPTDRVIDVGCANGFQTRDYSEAAQFTLGVDYIPEFIAHALELNSAIPKSQLDFVVGTILDLSPIKEKYGFFDKVVCERTLINLATWEEQMEALDQLDSLLKTGGYLLISEATVQGHESVDVVRKQYGLEILQKHWNNVYVDEQLLTGYLKDYELVLRESFSLYHLLSRVINAVLAKPGEPRFDAPINNLAYKLSKSFSLKEDIGHTVFFVFKKETW